MKVFNRLFGPQRKRITRRRTNNKKTGLVARITKFADQSVFSWEVRHQLYRHLSVQVENGVGIEESLDGFRPRLQRRKKITPDKIVGDVSRRMRDGSTLAAALGMWIPEDEAAVISSGELAGDVPTALRQLIQSKESVQRVFAAIQAALVRPVIYAVLIFAMMWMIGRHVTPGLEMALPKSRATGLVWLLYAAGDWANSWWIVTLPLSVIAVAVAVVRSLPRWTGNSRIKAEAFFPYSFYRDVQGFMWLMAFTSLIRVGVADVVILNQQIKRANPWLKERLHALWWRMDNGASLPDALMAKGKKGLLPFGFPNPDIIDDISSMAGFKNFAEQISIVAQKWAAELEISTLEKAKKFGFIMEVIMYVVMGVLMLAINSMSTQLGTNPGI
jgi:type II secretory pathway component PulF